MGSENVANQMKRKDKIMLLKQIMGGSITLENLKPRATIYMIDWGSISKVFFKGVNLNHDYMTSEANKIRPGCKIEEVVISSGYAHALFKNKKPLPYKNTLVNLEPEFEAFNIF